MDDNIQYDIVVKCNKDSKKTEKECVKKIFAVSPCVRGGKPGDSEGAQSFEGESSITSSTRLNYDKARFQR